MQSTLDEPAISSTWTPGSSPRSDVEKRGLRVRNYEVYVEEERAESVELERVRTFGEKGLGEKDVESWRMEPMLEARLVPGRNSVGVAF